MCSLAKRLEREAYNRGASEIIDDDASTSVSSTHEQWEEVQRQMNTVLLKTPNDEYTPEEFIAAADALIRLDKRNFFRKDVLMNLFNWVFHTYWGIGEDSKKRCSLYVKQITSALVSANIKVGTKVRWGPSLLQAALSEKNLIEALRMDDDAAWKELYDLYKKKINETINLAEDGNTKEALKGWVYRLENNSVASRQHFYSISRFKREAKGWLFPKRRKRKTVHNAKNQES